MNWFLLAAVIVLVLTFRSPTGLANAYGIALSAIFATNTFLAFVVFRTLWRQAAQDRHPGRGVLHDRSSSPSSPPT